MRIICRRVPYGVRVAVSRVFAVWVILVAFMSTTFLSEVTPRPSLVASPASVSAPITSVPQASSRRARPQPSRFPPPQPPQLPVPSNTTLCLAQVLFFEASTEPFEGLQAVAATVFNRMAHPRYPSSLCGVVYQPYQYSWTLIAANWSRQPPDKFIHMARTFLQSREQIQDDYPVTHFHHVEIAPSWSHTLEHIITISRHKFYRG